MLAAELLARLVLDPVDYLLPQVAPDDFLSYRVRGYSGGHDAWGFRNIRTPESAEIVCIGDSMTYGQAAPARDSWPAILGTISGRTVYNMGLGGYGPTQYLYLMRTKAIQLHPKTVIVGFYLGNDLSDVYIQVRFNKNWSTYGKFDGSDENVPAFDLPFQPPPGKFLGGLRLWLSRQSLLYALLTRTSVFDFFRLRERRTAMAHDPGGFFTYRDNKHNVFLNVSHAGSLDLTDPRMQSAMEITKQLMLDMRSVAEKNAFRLIVALIPTKERVYAKLLNRAGYLDKYPRLADAVHDEDTTRDEIAGFLHQTNIETVDLLPALETAVDERDLYRLNELHPNKVGYRVIAVTINHYLNSPH